MILNAYSDSARVTDGISVKSCGHIFAKKGREVFRPNGREDWLLFYIAKGKERFFLPEESLGEAGSFLIYRPQEMQKHETVGTETGEFYYVHFTADESFRLPKLKSSVLYHAAPTARLCDAFEEILLELQEKNDHYDRICNAKLLELIFLFARFAEQNPAKRRDQSRMALVIATMNREYQKPFTLADFAAMCDLSKYHFLRLFRSVTGESPMGYLNRIRLMHAKEMLADKSLGIAQIAERCGFASPSYFCDAFKRKCGKSPSLWRKEQ